MQLTDGSPLDPEIAAFCEALNAVGCETVYSCGAHLDANPPKDRAYVTFSCPDTQWMERFWEFLHAPGLAAADMRRELRFDCLLGRYTVSLWAPAGKFGRAALDTALREWTTWVQLQPPVVPRPEPACAVAEGLRAQWPVPCQLTLETLPKNCPWFACPLAEPPRFTCRTALK